MFKKSNDQKNAFQVLNLNPKIQNYHFQSKFLFYSEQSKLLLLSLPNKQTLIFNMNKKQFSKSKLNSKPTSCTYHPQYNIWFILTDQYQLVVINQHNQILAVLQHIHQLLQSMSIYWVAERQFFMVMTTQRVFKMNVSIQSNVNSIKYLSSLMFEFKVIGVEYFSEGLDWNSHSRFQRKLKKLTNSMILKPVDYLYCWNSTQACIYQFQNQSINIKVFKKLARRQNIITDITLSPIHGILCVGNHIGHIKLYNFQDRKKMVHQFEGHQKQIIGLTIFKQDYLISGGLDHMLKIYNLIKFQEIYFIKLGTLINSLHFLGSTSILCSRQDRRNCFIANFSQIMQNMEHIINHQSSCVQIFYNQDWIIASLANQTGIVVNQKNYSIQLHILTPPNLGRFFNAGQQYFMHSDQGISLVNISKQSKQNYDIKKITDINEGSNIRPRIQNKILKSRNYSVIQDSKGIGYPIIVTACWVGYTKVYAWDNQTKINNTNQKKQLYFMFGTEKGLIFILKSTEIKFTAKIIFHSHPIVRIGYLNQTQNTVLFISVCKQNILVIWTMNENQPTKIIHSIKMPDYINFYRFFDPFIVLGQKSGNLRFYTSKFEYNSFPKIYSMHQSQNLQGHDSQIISVDFLSKQIPIFVSASTDNHIKVWTAAKNLLFTIKFFNQLQCVSWLNSHTLQFVVSHQGRLSILSSKKLKQKLQRKIKTIKQPNQQFSIEYHLKQQNKVKKRKLSLALPYIRNSDSIEKNSDNLINQSRSIPNSPYRITNKQPRNIGFSIKLEQSRQIQDLQKQSNTLNLPRLNDMIIENSQEEKQETGKNRYKSPGLRDQSTKNKIFLRNIHRDFKGIINLSLQGHRI